MKKGYTGFLCMAALCCALAAGCGNTKTQEAGAEANAESMEAGAEATGTVISNAAKENEKSRLEDGVYVADFNTDSSMFHVNEACDGKGTLTVKDGKMTIHISLASKKIVNLFPGFAEDAKKEGAAVLEPTVDSVTYSDGITEEVYGFDVPVPVLEEEFDLALIGTKGKWYDHKVSVSNPEKAGAGENTNAETDESANTETSKNAGSQSGKTAASATVCDLKDGEYTVDVTLEGGTGRATVSSPAALTVRDGKFTVRIEWSSPNYDYMKIGEETYNPVNTEGNSVFELPVAALDEKMEVVADTTAMGTPHEIEYTLTFHSDSVKED